MTGAAGRACGVLLFGLQGEGAQLVAVGRDALLDRLTEVLPQMEPVCDLQGVRAPSAAPSA